MEAINVDRVEELPLRLILLTARFTHDLRSKREIGIPGADFSVRAVGVAGLRVQN